MNNDEDIIEFEHIDAEEQDKEQDIAKYKLNTYGADFTLEVLNNKIREKEIVIPPFQRRYVWDQKKASKLIESFLLGLPVPQIFLYREEEKQDLLVVDGQQRLKSISFFFEEKFEDGKDFRLKGVKEKWEGLKYSDLDEPEKRILKNSILRATIFEQIEPNDNKFSMFEIFKRLNSGGVDLSQQEIRNCIYYGEVVEYLKELNNYVKWREILNKPNPDRRMGDIEMILRFFSLYDNWENYEKPMKTFISGWMEKNQKISKEEFKKYEDIFKRVINYNYESFGAKAFRLKLAINITLFDSISVALAHCKLPINNFKEKYGSLLKDEGYLKNIYSSTTDKGNVEGRIKIAIRYFSQ